MRLIVLNNGPTATGREDPLLSWRAKGLLWWLLNTAHKSVSSHSIVEASMEGRDAKDYALKELERQGYLRRVRLHREGRIAGWGWVVFTAPTRMTHEEVAEVASGKVFGTPQETKKSTQKKERKKDIFSDPLDNQILESQEVDVKSSVSVSPPSLKDRTARFVPYAKKLAYVIKQAKNIKTSPQRLQAWANEIRKLHEVDGVSTRRIKQAIIWYRKNIGGQYVPVVESGESLRNKFVRLEDAMARAGDDQPDEEDGFRIGGIKI